MFLGARFSLVYMPTSPYASFTQKLQDGGRIPEVVITLRLRGKMISLLSQQLRHSFRAHLIHLHLHRHCLTIRCKREVETVSQTGSSNNLATETDVIAIAVAIPMFFGSKFFTGVYANFANPPDASASFTQKFKDSGWLPVNGSSYNFAVSTIEEVGRACPKTMS